MTIESPTSEQVVDRAKAKLERKLARLYRKHGHADDWGVQVIYESVMRERLWSIVLPLLSDAWAEGYDDALNEWGGPLPDADEVRTIADLAARHFGRTITLGNLVAVGADWDAPRVEVTGKLTGMHRRTSAPVVILDMATASGPYHPVLPLTHPVRLEA